ncbi:armadillo-type protein [Lipomyces oligophaga]|uniref:armadillo-type protein n=1 Tax=Lipomyces oligophaga TaxID=45792 RepID=UPI0034D020EF
MSAPQRVLPNPLDVAKLQALSAEKQHIFLFTWLSDLHHYLCTLDGDGATAHQMFIKTEIGKLSLLQGIALTHPNRVLAGRCYTEIFSKSDRKTLFDVINDLLNALNAGKADKNIPTKLYLAHVIGDIFACAGDSILSMAPHAVMSLLRLVKYSSNNAGYAITIFTAISQVFSLAGSFVEDGLAREVWRAAKNGANDKSALVRAAAMSVFSEIFKTVPSINTVHDLDSLERAVVKSFEFPQSVTRKAAAVCWASALTVASSTVQSVIEVPQKRAKKTQTQAGRDGDDFSAEEESSQKQHQSQQQQPPQTQQQSQQQQQQQQQQPPQVIKQIVENVTISFADALQRMTNLYCDSASTSSKVRTGVIETYTEFLFFMGTKDVEQNYSLIMHNLLDQCLSHPNINGQANRNRRLLARRHISFLLNEVIGQQLLGEQGRIEALKLFISDYLQKYPRKSQNQYEPTKYSLTGALDALTFLMETLGDAIIPYQNAISQGLLSVLQHPNYTVQIAVCSSIRAFLLHVPANLSAMAKLIISGLERNLALLKSRRMSADTIGRCLGFSTGLATVIGIANLRPQFASVELASEIYIKAERLLRSSGEVDVLVSSTQIQVAWTLVSGLMSLGPTFVKLHLNQLLLLWKSALQKPTSQDATTDKNALEYSFLLHVRECALTSIFVFLQHNRKLITNDVAKRIILLMQNTSVFLNLVVTRTIPEGQVMRLCRSLALVDHEMMVRRRVYQCYIALIEMQHGDGLQAELLTSAVSMFAEPDKYTSPLSTVIAATSGAYESVWEVTDNYAYGVTSYIQCFDLLKFTFERSLELDDISKSWLTTDSLTARTEQMYQEPILGSMEHDYTALFRQHMTPSGLVPWQTYPKYPHTTVVDTAIELFVLLLPRQVDRVQQSILEQVASFMGSSSLTRNFGRKDAVTSNVAVALSGVLKLISSVKSTNKLKFSDEKAHHITLEMLRVIAIRPDPYVRMIGADAIGRLCAIAGPNLTNFQIKYSVDEIVHNRDPHARAGLALSFGSINSHLGGMAASSHLKTITGILMSLCNDPHPVVHFWALKALASTMESAGLSFNSYSTSAIGMLCSLYLSDSHNPECTSVLSSNLEADFSTVRVIGHCVDALVGVLGPDLQEMRKNRELITLLIREISNESDPFAVVEAIKSYQHSILFAPQYFDQKEFCLNLTKYINSPIRDVRDAVIDGYYQLIRNDVNSVFACTGRALEGHIWLAFDMTPWHEGVKSIILTWLSQTGVSEAHLWVARCQAILTKLVRRKKKQSLIGHASNASKFNSNEPDLKDEEVASFAATEQDSGKSSAADGGERFKWQTRVFALSCLKELLKMNSNSLNNLVPKVGDIIRIAFSASTANVLEMRLIGVSLLDDILLAFGRMPDPEFPDTPMLEQYQAQIASALTPSFGADSSPELAAAAIRVCADFIASEIVKDQGRMGRVLKLLVTALENCTVDGEEIKVGELRSVSLNSTVMLRVAILTAWAEIQSASETESYLADIVKPHIARLSPLWISVLKEFAQVRFDPSSGNDSVSTNSLRPKDGILQFYEAAWLKIVEAIATLVDQDPEAVMSVLGEHPSSNGTSGDSRDQPASFFFVLFGISFEALVKAPNGDVLARLEDMPRILKAVEKFLVPAVCGSAIYDEQIFSETLDLLDRVIIAEDMACILPTIQILKNLCVHHPATESQYDVDINGEHINAVGISQMLELVHEVILALARIYPGLNDSQEISLDLSEEIIKVTKEAMDALVEMIEAFPFDTRLDLYATYLHIYSCFLEIPACQENVVPMVLSSVKIILGNIVKSVSESDAESYATILQEVRSFLAIFTTTLDRLSQSHDYVSYALRKNCLLSMVVVITTCEHILAANDPLIDECVAVVVDSLSESELSSVTSKCAKSLLITSGRGSFTQILGRKLLPQIVALATRDDGTADSDMSQLLGDILVSFVKSLKGDTAAPAMSVCIPVILWGIKDETSPLSATQRAQLVELANADALTFKSVVTTLSPGQRMKMERLLRSSGATTNGQGSDRDSAPSIQLKKSFY